MEDVVEMPRHVNELCYVVVVVFKFLFSEEVFDVRQVAGEQIIHADNVVPFGEKAVAQVRTDEAGSAGDEDAFILHLVYLLMVAALLQGSGHRSAGRAKIRRAKITDFRSSGLNRPAAASGGSGCNIFY